LGHETGLHQIQGIGDGFIPAVLDVKLVDEVIEVTDEDAIETAREPGSNTGLLVGISYGTNFRAAHQLEKNIRAISLRSFPTTPKGISAAAHLKTSKSKW